MLLKNFLINILLYDHLCKIIRLELLIFYVFNNKKVVIIVINKNPLISVVVPIYNVQKYLDKCIESIINQTYKNLEIILIDDGSTDNSGEKCDIWAQKDKRIRVVHKNNGGLSDARNTGIKISTGEYIGFIDGDDYINEKMFEKMIISLIENDADLVICNYDFIDTNNILTMPNMNIIKNEILKKNEVFLKLIEAGYFYYITAVNKLYKKSLFNTIKFPVGRINEDEFVVHHIFNECKIIVTINDILYYYVQRTNSIMNEDFSIKRVDGVYALLDRYYFYKCNGLDDFSFPILQQAYGIMVKCINNLSISDNKKIILNARNNLIKELRLNLRTAKLLVLFWKKYLREILAKIKFIVILKYNILNCLGKDKIILMGTPSHGNLGDQAIVYAEYLFFNKNFGNRKVFEIRSVDYLRYRKIIKKHINYKDWIIIDGGGNLGTLWPKEDKKITDIVEDFKKNKIIIFPQTCFYENTIESKNRLENNYNVYKNCKQLYMSFRDKNSYNFANSYFLNIKKYYLPDIVLYIDDLKYSNNRSGVLLCFRNDIEKVISNDDINKLKINLKEKNIPYTISSTLVEKVINKRNRNKQLNKKWEEFAKHRLIITDRLHGMLFAAITGTPCIALDNKSKKVGGVYEWINDLKYIKYVSSFNEIYNYIDKLYESENYNYNLNNINLYFKDFINDIKI